MNGENSDTGEKKEEHLMSELRAEKLVKVYGKKEVLHGVDLMLEQGKIYGMIGRNGAGKTTILSILAAHNPATAGSVTLDGETVWENAEVLKNICFSRELNVSNVTGGIAGLKVKEYLRVAETFYPYWDKKMAAELVKEFGLETKKTFQKLSKGMVSMVTIIVALASKAPFTFLDEPVAGLDVVAREKFYRILMDEYMETGRTFVISTHIIEEAADVFEEVIFVDKGEILLMENTQELLERSYHVSGREDSVKAAVSGMEAHHEEHIGRSMGVTVLAKPGETFVSDEEIEVQKISLQKLFVALCGEE